MELQEDRKVYIFEKRESRWEKPFILSCFFHFLLVLLLIFSIKIFPENFLKVAGKEGTMSIGDTISAGLVAKVKGESNFYKPPVRKLKKRGYVVKENKKVSTKNFLEKKAKSIKKKKTKKEIDKNNGNISGNSNVNEGIKNGEMGNKVSKVKTGGISFGTGGEGGGGIYSSWYAREVESKISRNWLTSQMGVVYNRICKVVVSFEIEPDGKIVNVKITQKNAPESFIRSALRAVYASNPLPELPEEYKMKGENVKFIAIFEYPPR